MGKLRLGRRFTAIFTAAAAAAVVFAGSTAAAPAAGPEIDWNEAASALREVAEGNPAAAAAMDRLLASPLEMRRMEVALPAQPFQIPAYSDTGRMDPATGQLYGSGIALGADGFRFGFFGGPGTISPNQGDAKLEVVWLNLLTGQSGTDILNQHMDLPIDTTMRSRVINVGGGPVVAAIYGSMWHRFPVPVSEQNPDGFKYVKSTIFWPSLGSVLG
ncbi:hypothetical protein [Antrihabitans sp. YC2-6]|uniref:hypothetical protein n=1 Tax=Antrihabitans sp. YC2-6 TaxID=2799498 RepID=UPI0018F55084|nr:hypothetical protein [Antrihabitans sp. YC2-6]MBJ8343331.1 hypothetical protein [Antrihabitans sp. YC2-6]